MAIFIDCNHDEKTVLGEQRGLRLDDVRNNLTHIRSFSRWQNHY